MNHKMRITTAIGSLTAASFSIGAAAAVESDDVLFEIEDLDRGFMMAHAATAEGKCGEEEREKEEEKEEESEEEKGEEGACGEGHCGEGKCGEGMCGEGACGEGSCGSA